MSDKNYDNRYSIYYSAKNNIYKSESSIYFQRGYSLYKKLEDQIAVLKNKSDIKKLTELIDLELEMYTNLSTAGEQIMK
jgi:isocitrate dehydrogenase